MKKSSPFSRPSASLPPSAMGWAGFTRRRSMAVLGILALVIGGLGALTWQWVQRNRLESFDAQVQVFREQFFADFKGDKGEAAAVLGEVQKIAQTFAGASFLAPFLVEVAGELMEREQTHEVAKLLEQYGRPLKSSPYMQALLGIQLAAAYEDLLQYSQAVSVLKELIPLDLMADKFYFDLGRYHKLQGDSPQAQQSFDYVIKHYPNSPFAKLAKAYMRETHP